MWAAKIGDTQCSLLRPILTRFVEDKALKADRY